MVSVDSFNHEMATNLSAKEKDIYVSLSFMLQHALGQHLHFQGMFVVAYERGPSNVS